MNLSRNVPTTAQIECFAQSISGHVSSQLSPGYESLRCGLVWNGRPPEHYPFLIVTAHTTADVAKAVDFAKCHGLAISARGSGHSYSAVFLCDGGLLLDLSQLNDITVERSAHRLSVGAGARSGPIAAVLAQEGLAFPVGHDTQVGIGGFLLGGGLGINCAAWGGMSSFNILAADIVTADGKTQYINAGNNPDLFWALRGGGPGLPFIVTRFHLHCYDHPGLISSNTWLFHFSDLLYLTQDLEAVASSLDPRLQVMVAIFSAPPELTELCSAEDCGRIVALTAMAFAEDVDDASLILGPLASLPMLSNAIVRTENPSTRFAEIQEQGKALLVSQRFRTDNILCDNLGDAVKIVMQHLPMAPSPASLSLIVLGGQKTLPEAAYSVSGRYFVSTYAQWDLTEDDQVNAAWLKGFYDDMAEVATSAYINEFDLEGRRDEVSRCYSAAAFERLVILRQSYDPMGVFYNPFAHSCP
ncbi:FAD-binding oxidoreductase [Buttiauxella noackiae]|uniref:FAD-binding oxidoreductase n=1 Tax=Buttiauxella noackiae TaxID=82992 RepID=UPI0035A72BFD